MAITAKSLKLPTGNEYSFIGKTWYGVCTTSANTANKYVAIQSGGFSSSDLTAGVRVVVSFQYAQNYDGYVYLNVNNTGGITIVRKSYLASTGREYAGKYEWDAGAIIGFIYNGSYWVIEDGERASTSGYGKTLLSNVASANGYVALTPYALQNSIREILDNQYQGNDSEITVLLDTTTPSADAWTYDSVQYNDIALLANLNSYNLSNRIIKVTYGDMVSYHQLFWNAEDNAYSWFIYYVSEMDYVSVVLDIRDSRITIGATSTHQGAYPFKVELYEQEAAGFVSYPIFKDTVGDIETLLASI